MGKSGDLFYQFQKNKEQIELELNEKLDWRELPGKKASRILIEKEANVSESSQWEEYFAWLLNQAEKFYKVFPKYQQ